MAAFWVLLARPTLGAAESNEAREALERGREVLRTQLLSELSRSPVGPRDLSLARSAAAESLFTGALAAYDQCKTAPGPACAQAAILFALDGQTDVALELEVPTIPRQDLRAERSLLQNAARLGLIGPEEVWTLEEKLGESGLVEARLSGVLEAANSLRPADYQSLARLCQDDERRMAAQRLISLLTPSSSFRADTGNLLAGTHRIVDFHECSIQSAGRWLTLPAGGWKDQTAWVAYGDRSPAPVRVVAAGSGAVDLSEVDWAQPRIVVRKTPADASARIDGEPATFQVGETGELILKVTAGSHSVEVSHEGRVPWTAQVDVDFAEVRELESRLDLAAPAWRPYVAWLGAGVTLVGGAVYGTAAAMSANAATELSQSIRSDGAYDAGAYQNARNSDERLWPTQRVGLLIGGAGALAAGVALIHWLLEDNTAPEW
ncbi:MAG: PEGA domain-containing protein [Deltaproteobacteria bacterium]|nr:PEGA domain-containing protein [Deltaproteobacteria bacterium]